MTIVSLTRGDEDVTLIRGGGVRRFIPSAKILPRHNETPEFNSNNTAYRNECIAIAQNNFQERN